MVGNRLKDKRVLVTAAGQGIGRASALAIAAEGAHVFATDVNVAALESLLNEGIGTIEVFELDARNNLSVIKGVERSNPDVLFNCAGFVHSGTVLDV